MVVNFIRIDPDEEDFNIFKVINEIHRHIKKLTKTLTEKSTKKSLIDELSNKILRLEFESKNSIKTKCLKYIANFVKYIVKHIVNILLKWELIAWLAENIQIKWLETKT